MKRTKATVLLLVLSLLVSHVPLFAADNYKNGQDITGSWQITVTVPVGQLNCSGPEDCVIFALATATSDGTVVQTAALPNVSSGHGVWTRTGQRHFSIRSEYFRFDSTNQFVGTSVTVTEITLEKTGTVASGTFENTLFDIFGNEIGSFSGTAAAIRNIP